MKLVYIAEDACVECRLCELACYVEHSPTKDILDAYQMENRPMPKCTVDVNLPFSASIMCRHCIDAPCLTACQNGSIHTDSRGAIIVNEETCVGCWMCIMMCPYGVITRDERRGYFGVSNKCDLCPDRETPACVDVCPNGALLFDDRDETYGDKS